MKKIYWILIIICLLGFIVQIINPTKVELNDPIESKIKESYKLYLTDTITGDKIKSTELTFTEYKNGTFACGQLNMDSDNLNDAQDECFELLKVRYLTGIKR